MKAINIQGYKCVINSSKELLFGFKDNYGVELFSISELPTDVVYRVDSMVNVGKQTVADNGLLLLGEGNWHSSNPSAIFYDGSTSQVIEKYANGDVEIEAIIKGGEVF